MTIRTLFLIAALALLSACSSPAGAPAEPPLAGARIGGAFDLVDQDGRAFTDADLKGKYAIVYFGYSYCPDVCPVDLQKLMRGLAAFRKTAPDAAANVRPVFITIDPQRDTPAVLKAFVAGFGEGLIGLTGTPSQVDRAAKAYVVVYQKREGSAPDAYLMAHSQLAYLMGPDGKPIALLPIDDPSTDVDEGAPALVAAELARWVKPAGR